MMSFFLPLSNKNGASPAIVTFGNHPHADSFSPSPSGRLHITAKYYCQRNSFGKFLHFSTGMMCIGQVSDFQFERTFNTFFVILRAQHASTLRPVFG
eukprot:m.177719 g.177719  ORF g.177719 m.177719 type:complete len:97 (+) comp25347_c0_seq9:954-1244(+)